MVFVLGTGTMINANTSFESTNGIKQSNILVSPDCFEVSNRTAAWLGAWYNLTYEEEHNMFLALMDRCLEDQKQ